MMPVTPSVAPLEAFSGARLTNPPFRSSLFIEAVGGSERKKQTMRVFFDATT
jgi:hypothetical protein